MLKSVLLIAILLASCTSDMKDTKLADIDLNSMETLQRIRTKLNAEDGAALASYVLRHRVQARNFCGNPLVGADGKPPETIGEAINLTRSRDAEERRAMAEANRPKHPRELARQKWDDLVRQRDLLIDGQSRLRSQHGEAAESSLEWTLLTANLEKVDRRLELMKPQVFDSDPGLGRP